METKKTWQLSAFLSLLVNLYCKKACFKLKFKEKNRLYCIDIHADHCNIRFDTD